MTKHTELKMLEAHCVEIERIYGADVNYNCGWAQSPFGITSKIYPDGITRHVAEYVETDFVRGEYRHNHITADDEDSWDD